MHYPAFQYMRVAVIRLRAEMWDRRPPSWAAFSMYWISITKQDQLTRLNRSNMTRKIFLSLIVISALILALQLACSKGVTGRTDNLPPLVPAKSDINAGTWKPILLTGPTEFPVAAPIATTTPEYIAQINEIKTWQKDLTSE